MASWTLIPCLKQLFAEFDRIAPKRDKASDGAIGDTAHSQSSSDHNPDETGNVPIHDSDRVNEVHAIDVDNNFNEPGLTMEMVVQFLLARCRSGAERRLRYIIWDRRIWSASSGWVQKTYTGASPHTEHAHFSASYVSELEASTASWHLEDIPVALTAADKTWISQEIATQVTKALEGGAVARGLRGQPNNLSDTERLKLTEMITTDIFSALPAAILAIKTGDKANPGRTIGDLARDYAKERGVWAGDARDTANADLAETAPLSRVIRAADVILAGAENSESQA